MSNHIDIQDGLLPLIGRKEDVLDGITGFVEHYDFSRANSSYEARVQAITTVASICYQSPKALGSVSLFNRLQAESAGLPSSSYEFIPVLLSNPQLHYIACSKLVTRPNLNIVKYGELVKKTYNSPSGKGSTDYWLTNLRALIEDVGEKESLNYLNTSYEEIQIIRDNFKVFLFDINLAARAQMVRHRVNWQELSRRYVSGKKKEFSFYERERFQDIEFRREDHKLMSITEIYDQQSAYYYQALEAGARPEEARDLLPQAMMTQIWGAFQPKQLEGFFKLRLHKTAQKEIQQVAKAMHELISQSK